MRVGVISDTHGLLRPEALAALRGSDLLLHAGDAGSPEVLEGLRALAPVKAVRGNVDLGPWAERLPESLALQLEEVVVWMRHGHLPPAREPPGARVRIVGHSHRPRLDWHGEVLELNPGSAGPRRFDLPISVARLTIGGSAVQAELIRLEPP